MDRRRMVEWLATGPSYRLVVPRLENESAAGDEDVWISKRRDFCANLRCSRRVDFVGE